MIRASRPTPAQRRKGRPSAWPRRTACGTPPRRSVLGAGRSSGMPSSTASTFEVPPGSTRQRHVRARRGRRRPPRPCRRRRRPRRCPGPRQERPHDLGRVAGAARRRVDELEARARASGRSARSSRAAVALPGGGVVDEEAALHERREAAQKQLPSPVSRRAVMPRCRYAAPRRRGRAACAAGSRPGAGTARRGPRACRGPRRARRRSRRRRPGRRRTSR